MILSSKYNKALEKITVDDEMRQRILKNISEVSNEKNCFFIDDDYYVNKYKYICICFKFK